MGVRVPGCLLVGCVPPTGQVLDARKLPFAAGSFDLVVDKGTVDAMLCDNAGKDSAR